MAAIAYVYAYNSEATRANAAYAAGKQSFLNQTNTPEFTANGTLVKYQPITVNGITYSSTADTTAAPNDQATTPSGTAFKDGFDSQSVVTIDINTTSSDSSFKAPATTVVYGALGKTQSVSAPVVDGFTPDAYQKMVTPSTDNASLLGGKYSTSVTFTYTKTPANQNTVNTALTLADKSEAYNGKTASILFKGHGSSVIALTNSKDGSKVGSVALDDSDLMFVSDGSNVDQYAVTLSDAGIKKVNAYLTKISNDKQNYVLGDISKQTGTFEITKGVASATLGNGFKDFDGQLASKSTFTPTVQLRNNGIPLSLNVVLINSDVTFVTDGSAIGNYQFKLSTSGINKVKQVLANLGNGNYTLPTDDALAALTGSFAILEAPQVQATVNYVDSATGATVGLTTINGNRGADITADVKSGLPAKYVLAANAPATFTMPDIGGVINVSVSRAQIATTITFTDESGASIPDTKSVVISSKPNADITDLVVAKIPVNWKLADANLVVKSGDADGNLTVVLAKFGKGDGQQATVTVVDDTTKTNVETFTVNGANGTNVDFNDILVKYGKAGYDIAKVYVVDNATGIKYTLGDNSPVFDANDNVIQTYTLHLEHVISTETKPFTETIHYVYDSGKSAGDDNVQTVNWTITTDKVTGKSTYVHDKDQFDAVTSPTIPGWTADKPSIEAVVFNDGTTPENIVETVTYTTNTGNSNSGSNNTGDHNQGNSNSGSNNVGNSNSGNSNSGSNNVGDGNHGDSNSGNSNSGSNNTGDHNQGNSNSGSNNVGDGNHGDSNSGNSNSGSNNTGDHNQGNSNSGSNNVGDGNHGDSNSGDSNSGSNNTGDHNQGNSNSGSNNVGNSNSGNSNSGSNNVGDGNHGDSNTGNSNSGNSNSGSNNVGDGNYGNSNSGSNNTGNNNLGNNNSGDHNQGDFNTGSNNVGDGNVGDGNVGNNNTGNNNHGDNLTGDNLVNPILEVKPVTVPATHWAPNLNITKYLSNKNILYNVSGPYSQKVYTSLAEAIADSKVSAATKISALAGLELLEATETTDPTVSTTAPIYIDVSGTKKFDDEIPDGYIEYILYGDPTVPGTYEIEYAIGKVSEGTGSRKIIKSTVTIGESNTGNSNSGNNNTGDSNSGNSNSGSNNVGDGNHGDSNTGNSNSGNSNSGSNNVGDGNHGDSNSGNSNSGSNNTGDHNQGNSNSGSNNVGNSNSGNSNSGSNNVGDGNHGDSNSGNSNSGSNNTGDHNQGNSNSGSNNVGNSNSGNSNSGSNNVGDGNHGDSNTGNSNSGNSNSGSNNTGDHNQGNSNSGSNNVGNSNSGNSNSGSNNVGGGNHGDSNTGNSNSGNSNSGSNNVGDGNHGDSNTGNSNSGNSNSGSNNVGDGNHGDSNSGNSNSGSNNTGDHNQGNSNSGSNNVGNSNSGNSNSGSNNVGDGNHGDSNTGNSNSGNSNSGSNNVGDGNHGDSNSGNSNSGSNNTGDHNQGNSNSGSNNIGDGNHGDSNTGNSNSGNSNSGSNNTGDNNHGNSNSGSNNTGDNNIGNNNNGNNNNGNNNHGNGNVGDGNVGNNNVGNNNHGDNLVGDGLYNPVIMVHDVTDPVNGWTVQQAIDAITDDHQQNVDLSKVTFVDRSKEGKFSETIPANTVEFIFKGDPSTPGSYTVEYAFGDLKKGQGDQAHAVAKVTIVAVPPVVTPNPGDSNSGNSNSGSNNTSDINQPQPSNSGSNTPGGHGHSHSGSNSGSNNPGHKVPSTSGFGNVAGLHGANANNAGQNGKTELPQTGENDTEGEALLGLSVLLIGLGSLLGFRKRHEK